MLFVVWTKWTLSPCFNLLLYSFYLSKIEYLTERLISFTQDVSKKKGKARLFSFNKHNNSVHFPTEAEGKKASKLPIYYFYSLCAFILFIFCVVNHCHFSHQIIHLSTALFYLARLVAAAYTLFWFIVYFTDLSW